MTYRVMAYSARGIALFGSAPFDDLPTAEAFARHFAAGMMDRVTHVCVKTDKSHKAIISLDPGVERVVARRARETQEGQL